MAKIVHIQSHHYTPKTILLSVPLESMSRVSRVFELCSTGNEGGGGCPSDGAFRPLMPVVKGVQTVNDISLRFL